jgi:hypothetical protein
MNDNGIGDGTKRANDWTGISNVAPCLSTHARGYDDRNARSNCWLARIFETRDPRGGWATTSQLGQFYANPAFFGGHYTSPERWSGRGGSLSFSLF